jgi:hypothetical protein
MHLYNYQGEGASSFYLECKETSLESLVLVGIGGYGGGGCKQLKKFC